MFTSTGIIRYDPPRPNMKRGTQWWAVVNVDKEITRYFRYWIKNRYWIDLAQPSFNAHISIIRGERPPEDKMDLWKKYDGVEVEFTYTLNVRQSGDTTGGDRPNYYWFVNIECPFLKQIRNEFGFRSDWSQHLTIGRTW